MKYYPVFLDVAGRPAFIIGGGAVAERKARSLMAAGARVTVISPRATKGIEALASKGALRLVRKRYSPGLVDGAFIVICASGSKAANEAARREARSLGMLVNVVDDPDGCDFIAPSVVDRGSLVIAVSTSGKSPLLSKTIREGLEEAVGAEYRTFVDILGAVRKKLLKSNMNNGKKERVFKELVNSPIPGLLQDGAVKEINGYLKKLLGRGFSFSALGIRVPAGEKKPSK